MRVLGAMLCMLPIASVLDERAATAPAWILLALNGFVWPHLAAHLNRRARDPVAAEFRCLALDSAFGGAWIAAMAVSVAPSAVLITMLTADKIAAGGWALLRRSTAALLGSFVLVWLLLGCPFQPLVSQRTLLASVPFLFLYAVALSVLTHRQRCRIAAQNRELERINRTDPVMQLPNRRHFEARALHEFARHRKTARPVSLLLVDVDRFKTINDLYGHGMGDIVLKRVAEVLRQSVRDVDLPARYGGDEFAVLLVDTGAARAAVIAERIRSRASALTFAAEPGLRCTVSIGLAELSDDHQTPDRWIQAADAALYRAKAAGRDRVAAA